MSTPAGWYDDGSGRQRWWDGVQWTANYAPAQGVDAGALPESAAAPTPSGPKSAPTLGFIGLGLAVLGTILACIPTVATFILGVVVLFAAFVVSLIAVFKKNTAKWPSIVGIVLSIVGGVIGSVVFATVLLLNFSSSVEQLPTDLPTSTASEQPSASPGADASEDRPSPEAIGEGYVANLQDESDLDEFKTPEAVACIGQRLYDSDLPDELLQRIASGEVITEESLEPQVADLLKKVLTDAGFACVSQ